MARHSESWGRGEPPKASEEGRDLSWAGQTVEAENSGPPSCSSPPMEQQNSQGCKLPGSKSTQYLELRGHEQVTVPASPFPSIKEG